MRHLTRFGRADRIGAIWKPDAAPASPGALDDEFADASGGVPGGWTEVDHGNSVTVVESAAGLEISSDAASATLHMAGIYKTIPAGDFTIWTKYSLGTIYATHFSLGGLALWVDATDSTADAVFFYILTSHTFASVFTDISVSHWNDYTSFNSNVGGSQDLISSFTSPNQVYFRVRRNGTTYAFEMSSDGFGWMRIHSGTLPVTPTHVGPLHGRSNQTNTSRFSFFRYLDSDVGFSAYSGGRRVRLFS